MSPKEELVRLRKGRGTSACHYRCSVPGLAGFAAARLHGFRSLAKQRMKYKGGRMTMVSILP